jgi:hypothetical protein
VILQPKSKVCDHNPPLLEKSLHLITLVRSWVKFVMLSLYLCNTPPLDVYSDHPNLLVGRI